MLEDLQYEYRTTSSFATWASALAAAGSASDRALFAGDASLDWIVYFFEAMGFNVRGDMTNMLNISQSMHDVKT